MTQRRRLFPIAALAAATIAAAGAGQAAAQAPPASCGSALTTADMRECLDLRLRRAEAGLARVTATLRAVPGVDLDRLAPPSGPGRATATPSAGSPPRSTPAARWPR